MNKELNKVIKKLESLNIPKYNKYDLQAYSYKAVEFGTYSGLRVDAIKVYYDCYANNTRGFMMLEQIKKSLGRYKNIVIAYDDFKGFTIFYKPDFIAYENESKRLKIENDLFCERYHYLVEKYGYKKVFA